MEIRDKLVRLHRLKIGAAVCRVYAVTPYDLELLAIAEDVLNPNEEETTDGNGSNLDTECEG